MPLAPQTIVLGALLNEVNDNDALEQIRRDLEAKPQRFLADERLLKMIAVVQRGNDVRNAHMKPSDGAIIDQGVIYPQEEWLFQHKAESDLAGFDQDVAADFVYMLEMVTRYYPEIISKYFTQQAELQHMRSECEKLRRDVEELENTVLALEEQVKELRHESRSKASATGTSYQRRKYAQR